MKNILKNVTLNLGFLLLVFILSNNLFAGEQCRNIHEDEDGDVITDVITEGIESGLLSPLSSQGFLMLIEGTDLIFDGDGRTMQLISKKLDVFSKQESCQGLRGNPTSWLPVASSFDVLRTGGLATWLGHFLNYMLRPEIWLSIRDN